MQKEGCQVQPHQQVQVCRPHAVSGSSMGCISDCIKGYPGLTEDTTVDIYMEFCQFTMVTYKDMVNTLKDVASIIAWIISFTPLDLLCEHTLMYLGKIQIYTIMVIVSWSSNTFLFYIWKQEEQSSHNVAQEMLPVKDHNHIPY